MRSPTIHDLPPELLLRVVTLVHDAKTRCRLCCVSRQWREAASSAAAWARTVLTIGVPAGAGFTAWLLANRHRGPLVRELWLLGWSSSLPPADYMGPCQHPPDPGVSAFLTYLPGLQVLHWHSDAKLAVQCLAASATKLEMLSLAGGARPYLRLSPPELHSLTAFKRLLRLDLSQLYTHIMDECWSVALIERLDDLPCLVVLVLRKQMHWRRPPDGHTITLGFLPRMLSPLDLPMAPQMTRWEGGPVPASPWARVLCAYVPAVPWSGGVKVGELSNLKVLSRDRCGDSEPPAVECMAAVMRLMILSNPG